MWSPIMQNLISFNQLADWNQKEYEADVDDPLTDYFECITECDESSQSCKRMCRPLLMT